MNKSYRSLWNESLGAWVAASELTGAGGKRSSARVVAASIVAAAALGGLSGAASAAVIGTPVQAQDGAYSSGAASATGGDSTAVGAGSKASAQGATAVGAASKASSGNSTAVGIESEASGNQSLALGYKAKSSGLSSTAIGALATAEGIQSIAMGASATVAASATNGLAIGTLANAGAVGAMALGSRAVGSGVSSVALGVSAVATADHSVALGADSTTTANLAGAAYNAGASALSGTASAVNGEVSIGSTGSERRLTNLAAGSALTDAVNVSQLRSESDKSNTLGASGAASLGGGASYDATTGAINAPTYNVGGNVVHNIGDALGNIDGRTTTNATNIASNNTAITQLGNSVSTLAGTAITFSSNNGSVDRKLGEMMAIQGKGTSPGSYSGVNLRTQIDGNGNMQLQMADNLVLSSVAAGNTSLTYNGVSIAGGPSLTTSGIDAGRKKIGNVADGTADSDAATVGQVNAAATAASTDAVKYDDATHKRVTLGNTVSTDGGVTGGTKLTNVAQGQLSSTSTDAVNGAQLYTTNQQVASNTTNIANNTTAITNLGDTVNAINGKGAKYFHANSGNADSVASGSESVAIGPNAVASGAYAVAEGAGAKASGAHSIAIGDYSTASKDFAVAMGQNAQANGQQATALGQGAAVTADNATALGTGARASGVRSIAAGSFSNASGQNSAAFGDFANAQGGLSTALGNASTATGDYATAVGNGAAAGAQFATAIGNASSVSGMGGVAIGSGASASQDNSVAIGRRSTTQADLSLPAYNPNSSASIAGQTPFGEFSVGATGMERRITNVAAGASDTDAVNVSQLKAAGLVDGNGTALNAVTYDSAAKDSVTLGGLGAASPVKLKNVADGSDDTDAVNVRQLKSSGLVDNNGNSLDAVTYDAGSNRGVVTFGGGAAGTLLTNVRDGAIAAGSRDAVNGGQIAALRDTLQTQITHIDGRVTNIEANGVGGGGNVGGVAGGVPYLDGNANGADGSKADAGSTPGVAVGYNAKATGDNSSVLGQNATALGSYGTAVGNDSYAAGPNDTALGGNAKVHADGSVAVGANASVTSAAATNAVAVGADSRVSAASGTAVGQGAAVAASATGAVALGQGSVADRANTVSVGSAGNERQITNVAAGTAPTDAVNVQQLQNSQQSVSNYVDARANQLQSQINDNKRDSNAAIAGALAAANLPQSVFPGKSMMSAGVGYQDGESAVAIGMSKMAENGRWVTKLSGSVNTRGKVGVGAGIGYYW